ncbi:MAG: diaminopimelate decarboxylase [Actinomycetota bacterium]|nr:diaminopimelate decarboxylase [Actinomycetota bacterium]
MPEPEDGALGAGPVGLGPWPATAARGSSGVLQVGGVPTTELARAHGTPLWVVDEADLRGRCRAYRDAFAGAEVAYASKAWCTVGILQLVTQESLWVDVASGGELHTASVAGVPMGQVLFHGNNKSDEELRLAAELGVGRVVVDSFDEFGRLERIGAELGHTFPCWIRVTPGIDAHTHDYVRTGHDDTKFGFTLSLGLAEEVVARAATLDHVALLGAHAHVGSQIFGTDAFVAAAEVMVSFLADCRRRLDVGLTELNLGGGMGIRYTHEDHPLDVYRLAAAVLKTVEEACARHELAPPRLFVEPGRAIVGPSTLTLYRVGTVKVLPGIRTYASVDGGMSDNIRPALYGAEHEVTLANRIGEGRAPYTVVGKHCESGDLVASNASLPPDLQPGDLLAVAATGAYTESMASNYNRLPRPAAVIVRDGEVRPLIQRETYDDLVARDVPLRQP